MTMKTMARPMTIALLTTAVLLAATSGAGAAAIAPKYDFDAGSDGDMTWDSLGSPSPANSWALANITYNADPGSQHVGITGAYTYDGSTSDAEASAYGTGGVLNTSENASFEVWFKPNRTTLADAGKEHLFETGGAKGVGLALEDETDGMTVAFQTMYDNPTGRAAIKLTDDRLLGDFIQAVGVADYANGQVRLYVNGVLMDTDTSGTAQWLGGGDKAGLGSRGQSNSGGYGSGVQGFSPFNGDIGRARFYDNTAMTHENVVQGYNVIAGLRGVDHTAASNAGTAVFRRMQSGDDLDSNSGLESDTSMVLFIEKASHRMSTDFAVEHDGSDGLVDAPGDLVGGTIPAGWKVRSYYLHHDQTATSGDNDQSMTVTFENRIVGVIADDAANLDAGDAEFAVPGVDYDSGSGRYYSLGGADNFQIADSGTKLTVNTRGGDDETDALRVQTLAPQYVTAPPESPKWNWDAAAPGDDFERWDSTVNSPKEFQIPAVGAAARPTLSSEDPSTIRGIRDAFAFDGSDDTITTADQFLNDDEGSLSSNDASFEVWFKPNDLGGTNKGILFETGGAGTGSSLLIDQENKQLIFTIKNGGSSPFTTTRTKLTYDLPEDAGVDMVNTSNFIQLVGVYDKDASGDTDELKLYLNGNVLVASGSNTDIEDWDGGNSTGIGSHNGVAIGGDTANSGSSSEFEQAGYGTFDGEIAIFRLYDKALTATQIQNTHDTAYGVKTGQRINLDANTDYDGDGAWEDTITSPDARSGALYGDVARIGGPQDGGSDVSLPTAHINYAYQFDGDGDVVDLGDLNGLKTNNVEISKLDTTVEMWFKADGLSNGPQVLWETGGGTGASLTLLDNVLQWRVRGGNDNKLASVTYDITDISGDFIQVVGTITTSGKTIELFINGESIGIGTTTDNIGDWDGGDDSCIGGNGSAVNTENDNLGGFGNGFNFDGGYGSFDGEIAIFRIYDDTILTADEVMGNYTAIVPEPGTVGLLGLGGMVLCFRKRRNR